MPTFAYRGRTRGGQTVTGERVADTMDAAIAALRREQILVTRIDAGQGARPRPRPKPKKGGEAVAGEEPGDLHAPVLGDDRRRPAAGAVPRHPRQRRRRTRTSPRSSCRRAPTSKRAPSLADAMRKHPKTFDPLFTNMIAAGEAGGILDTILKRLATYIEKAVKLKGQVKSAMIYPIAVIVIAGVVVGVILWKVIPTFAAAVRRPRRRAAAADPRRHRAEQQPGRATARSSSSASARIGYALQAATTRPTNGRRVDRRACVLKMPILGIHHAQDRGGAVLPHAVDAASARACRFSTASTSPRGPPATPSSRTRSWRRARASSAARRSSAPLQGDQGVPADGRADDRRRRGDRRARHDAGEDRRLLRGGSRHRGRRPADAARADHDRRSSASSSAASSSRCTCRSST